MPVGYSPQTSSTGSAGAGVQRISWGASSFCLTPDSVSPEHIFADGTITSIVLATETAPVGSSETWNILINGSTQGTVILTAGATKAFSGSVPILVSNGDTITVRPTGALPATPSKGVTLTALFEAD